MKYRIDAITAITILGFVLFWIHKPIAEMDINDLSLRGVDGYPINTNHNVLILHIGSTECMTCKRDTQVLMRHHLQHPDIPIIDANILYTPEEEKLLREWKQTVDLEYTIAIIENPSVVPYPVPTTLVVQQEKTTKIFGALTYEKLIEVTKKRL